MADRDLRSWYLRYTEALNNHELDGMDEFINDEVLLDGVPGKRDDVVAVLKGIADAVPDIHWDFQEQNRLATNLARWHPRVPCRKPTSTIG